jgi:subtilisin family serine protease
MFRSRLLVPLMLIPLTAFAVEPALREHAPRHVILTPAAALTDADRVALAAEGIRVERVLPGGRFTARVEAGADLSDARIARVETPTLAQKIHATAWRVAAQAKPFAPVRVFFHEDVSFDDARAAVANAGGALDDPMATGYEPLNAITAHIAPASLTQLASDDRVLVVYGQRPFRAKTMNATAAALSHVNTVQAAPYNLSGDQVVLSYFELAPAGATNAEFQGRLTIEFTCTGVNNDADCKNQDNINHATHTAGTMIAAGLDPAAKGMAPKATLHGYRANVGPWLTQKQNALKSIGSVADSNSWGYELGWVNGAGVTTDWVWLEDSDELIGGYSGDVNAAFDHIAFLNGSLMIHAAGNEANVHGPTSAPFPHNHWGNADAPDKEIYCYSPSGSGTDCPAPPTCTAGAIYCETTPHPTHAATLDNPGGSVNWAASSKNTVTVGAVSDSKAIAGYSSRGPARDGRVKPELVAKGGPKELYSTFPSSTCSNPPCYGYEEGTSMATPVVTGTAALLTEQWRKLHNGANPGPQILKALLIAGADDLGNPGPDYTYGFGFLNAKASVDLVVADNGVGKRVKTDNAIVSTPPATFDYSLTLASAQDLRVVLTWFDPEVLPVGTEDVAGKTLVNDLDVKVVGPGGTTLPYVLDVNNPGANATRGVNTTDNTEEVEVKGAAAGTYHVIVTGTAVPQGPSQFVVVANADFGAGVPTCSDATEPNDITPYALPNGVTIRAAVCSSSDADLFSFAATAPGAVAVSVAATDTPLKATLLTNGVAGAPITIAAASTGTLTAVAGAGTTQYVVRIEPNGAIGPSAAYSITPSYPFVAGPHRRSARH